MEDVNAFIRKLNSLVSKICVEDDPAKCDDIAGQLMTMLDSVHKMSADALEKLPIEQQLQFQSSAVSLWNVAVAKKTSGAVSSSFIAKLRHLACNIAVTSSLGNTNFAVLKRHLCMTSKAGSDWLECGNPAMADQCLNLALQTLESLDFASWSSSDSLTDEGHVRGAHWLQDLQKDALKVYCCKGQVHVSQGQHQNAVEWIKRAKELLESLPEESSIVAMHCFNFGVDAMKRKMYQPCVDWFRESYELGKSNKPLEGSVLAKVLRLLASTYLEWDPEQYAQKAINAIGLANAEHSHPSGLHLKVKIILLSNGNNTKLQAAVDELWSHPDLTLDLATQTIHLLTKHNRLDVAVKSCKVLGNRFHGKNDDSKLKVLQIELLMKNKELTQAQEVLNQCITGSSNMNFDPSSLRTLHSLLWEQAAVAFENGDFNTALLWYNQSYGLFTHYMEMESANLARLQRNRASCFLNLKQFNKAEEAVRDSVKHDPRNPYTHFLSFRVALCNNSSEQAIEAIKTLSDSKFENEADCSIEPIEDAVVSLISLAAQQAFEHTNQEVAIEALEKLAEHSRDHKQLMTTYRCLIRLRCTQTEEKEKKLADVKKVWSYLKSAYELLQKISDEGTTQEITLDEANWFMKIAWNLAIENSESSELTYKFFSLCAEFCSLIGQDKISLGRQKTCLVMAAAACLQTARETTDIQEKGVLLEQVLQLVKMCRDVYSQLLGTDSSNNSDRALVLLNLYEFEALGKLGRTAEMELFAKQIAGNQTADIKTIETLAALAMEPPCQYKALSKKLLTVALGRHKGTAPVDVSRCSKILHSLIQLCLGDGNCNDSSTSEEAWNLFNDALYLLQNTEQLEYPEMEVLWLMTKSWNTGIYAYGTGKLEDANRWCSLSMKLLNFLTNFKQSYEPKMQALYEEVSSKMEDFTLPEIKIEP